MSSREGEAMARTRVEVRLPLWIVRMNSEALRAVSLNEPVTRSFTERKRADPCPRRRAVWITLWFRGLP
jgi:hypothetical protein